MRSAFRQTSAAAATISAPWARVLLVADAAALPGAGLDEDPVARARQFLDADGHHGDAVLVRLDLLGHADDALGGTGDRNDMASSSLRLLSGDRIQGTVRETERLSNSILPPHDCPLITDD